MDSVPLQPTRVVPGQGAAPAAPAGGRGGAFGDLLAQQLARDSGVRFSKHALKRLQQRDIHLTPGQLERLGSAVRRAAAKGARESLVLMDDLALVVSIRNQTVITATSAVSRQENVFTNIDSAVIA